MHSLFKLLSVGNQGYGTELKHEVGCCFSCVPLTCTVWRRIPPDTLTFAPKLQWQAVNWSPQVCDFSRRIRFSPGPVMVNTLMTNYINVKNHPSHTNTAPTNILSQCPKGRSFVCVYGFKCCWQVKINPTLLSSFPVLLLVLYFFSLLSSPSHLLPSFIQPYFPFFLVHFVLIVYSCSLLSTLQCHVILQNMLYIFISVWYPCHCHCLYFPSTHPQSTGQMMKT